MPLLQRLKTALPDRPSAPLASRTSTTPFRVPLRKELDQTQLGKQFKMLIILISNVKSQPTMITEFQPQGNIS